MIHEAKKPAAPFLKKSTERSKEITKLEEELYSVLDEVRQQVTKKDFQHFPLNNLYWQIAKNHGLTSFYNVVPNSTLREMSEERPLTLKGLRKLNIGEYKLNRYGKEFLQTIQAFLKKHPELITDTCRNSSSKRKATEVVLLDWKNKLLYDSTPHLPFPKKLAFLCQEPRPNNKSTRKEESQHSNKI